MSTLITGATVVNNGEIKNLDVFIQDGKIAKIADDLSSLADKAGNVIDANGLYLLPGMIDDQVHFRDPGLTHKADIGTESRAAVLGGITSYMEMPNTKPVTDCASEIKKKLDSELRKSHWLILHFI